MSNIRIKKVKITTEKKISMIYEKQAKSGAMDEYSFTCSEDARPEFYKAMEALETHVIDMCELPESYLSKITVRGVSFSWAQEVMGAVISASMDLDKSYQNLNLNTPHKASEPYSDNHDEMQLLSKECVEALKSLHEECEKYINGDRAQASMFNVA